MVVKGDTTPILRLYPKEENEMLSDPLSVTYDGVAKNLPRSSSSPLVRSRNRATTSYGNLASGLLIRINSSFEQWSFPLALERTELTLFSQTEDTDYPNGVGLVYYSDPFRENTAVEAPLLDTAVRTLVDGSIRARLINGEM